MSLALYNCRNRIFTNCRLLGTTIFAKNNIRGFIKFKERQSHSVLQSPTSSIARCYSFQTNPNSNDKPAYNPLMDYPPVCWPGFFRMVKCWLMFKLALPSFVKDFNLTEFVEGSQQAVCFVSDALSREDYDSLNGLVTPEAIEVLRKNIAKLSDDQKRQIRLEKRESFFVFPGEINVRNGTEASTKIVEIMLVFHFLRDWQDPDTPSKIVNSEYVFQKLDLINGTVTNERYPSHAIICNYQFVKDLGNPESSWSINILNQFKLCEVM